MQECARILELCVSHKQAGTPWGKRERAGHSNSICPEAMGNGSLSPLLATYSTELHGHVWWPMDVSVVDIYFCG